MKQRTFCDIGLAPDPCKLKAAKGPWQALQGRNKSLAAPLERCVPRVFKIFHASSVVFVELLTERYLFHIHKLISDSL